MRAGFQSNVSRRAFRCVTSLRESNGFSMRTSAWLRPASTNNLAVIYKYAAHRGVGPSHTKAPPRERQGHFHVSVIA